ncbi:phenylacetic acid degradation protein PaaX [Amycolatopsis acidicola]|uniref:Phenylacetic acid degradation protein PaaX n=2 Tax=Amycolatopsis acidicola TaxID=2596893 RepID=A0A5N0VHA7_9PSEU|nr:phenylacetic acid degradation protein PaaX [Amycolatopsis acidicola]
MGREERTARQAVARCAKAGWIEKTKHGRTVSWTLTPQGAEVISSGARRVGGRAPRKWDRRWLILSTTVRESRRATRTRLYAGLHWAGFGSPTPGLWVCPHTDRLDEVTRLIEDLGLKDETIAFMGTAEAVGIPETELVHRSWDLDALRSYFEQVLLQYGDLTPAPGDDTFFAYLGIVSELQRFPYRDPKLPEELVPDWVGRKAASTLWNLRDKWSKEATRRWAELNAGP